MDIFIHSPVWYRVPVRVSDPVINIAEEPMWGRSGSGSLVPRGPAQAAAGSTLGVRMDPTAPPQVWQEGWGRTPRSRVS